MEIRTAITGKNIHFDRDTLFADISSLLEQRLWDNIHTSSLQDLYDPYMLFWMKEAIERIEKAYVDKERVIIFWDYDVDGVTSTALVLHILKKIGIEVSYRLPHRVKDGYWLKKYFIDDIKASGATLMITVDCGTRDLDVVEYAKTLGVDVIITDHHAVPEKISDIAIAVINPQRKDCNYPFKYLSGAGVAFKMVMALARKFLPPQEAEKYIESSVDIAAIWTVADCMSLTWENRVIVQAWLKQIRNSRSKWIRKLIEHKIGEEIDADIFWFHIWPRLNAAGRMDTPYKALHLLLNQEESVIDTLLDIENLNDKRKKMTQLFYEDAQEKVDTSHNLLFYSHDDVEHGIIGIIAGRITENFHKPSIVLTSHGDSYVASCRSPEYFDIVTILEEFKEYFVTFWGHKQAAWFTIKKEVFDSFQKHILERMKQFDFSHERKNIFVDKVIDPREIGMNLLEKIQVFKPFWLGNLKPVFMIEHLEYTTISYLWSGVDHLKITTPFGYKICGFWFWGYLGDLKKAKNISLIFDLSEDTYNGKRSIMLKVIDIIID